MTTEINQDAVEAEAAKQDEKSVPAWAREQLEARKAEVADRDAKLERLAFLAIGVDPASGKAKAIKLSFDGEMDPENMEPVITHAKDELDMDLTLQGGAAPETTTKPEISAGEERLGKLAGGSVPPEDPDARGGRQAQAEADGDVLGALAAGIAQQLEDGTLTTDVKR